MITERPGACLTSREIQSNFVFTISRGKCLLPVEEHFLDRECSSLESCNISVSLTSCSTSYLTHFPMWSLNLLSVVSLSLALSLNLCISFINRLIPSVLLFSLSHVRVFVTPWNSPGQNTGVGSQSLLQGIFPNQGSNPGLLHCRWILYQLSNQGNLYISRKVVRRGK